MVVVQRHGVTTAAALSSHTIIILQCNVSCLIVRIQLSDTTQSSGELSCCLYPCQYHTVTADTGPLVTRSSVSDPLTLATALARQHSVCLKTVNTTLQLVLVQNYKIVETQYFENGRRGGQLRRGLGSCQCSGETGKCHFQTLPRYQN